MTETKQSRRGFLKAAGGAIVAVAVAIGLYEWYQSTTGPVTPTPTATTAAATTTTATGAAPTTATKPFQGVTIAFFTLDPLTSVANAMKAKFTEQTGINVNVIALGGTEVLNEKNLLELTGHKGSIDVLTNFVWMIGQNSAFYVPLEPLVQKYNVDLSDYAAWVLDQSCRYDDEHKFTKRGGGGVLYTLPTGADCALLLYRKDWFSDPNEKAAFEAKYGYDLIVPNPPDALTWKQFCDMLEFFTRPEKGIYGYAYAADPYTFWELWHPEAFSRGEYYTTDEGKPNLNSPGQLEAFNLALHYHRQGWVPKGASNMGYTEAQLWFKNGNVAIAQLWNMMYTEYTKPDFIDKVGYAFMPYWGKAIGTNRPLPPGVTSWEVPGSKPRMSSGGWNLGINKDSKNPDAAFLWIQFATSYEFGKYSGQNFSYFGARYSIYQDPELRKTNPWVDAALESWKGDYLWICWMRTNAFPQAVDPVTRYMHEALAGTKDPKVALDESQNAMVEIWKQFGYPT